MQYKQGMLIVCLLLGGMSSAAWADNYHTVKSHSYVWRADGNSATQGSGAIFNWPTLTGGTASCALSQVSDNTTLPAGAPLGGSTTLHYIKADCTGGASGGTIEFYISTPVTSLNNLGQVGIFFYQSAGDDTVITNLQTYLAETNAYAKFFIFTCNGSTSTCRRRNGWNIFQWQRDDQAGTGGGYLWTDTAAQYRQQMVIAAGGSVTVYFSDLIYGFAAKPQITVWSADNIASGYSVIYNYMSAAGRRAIGSYCPTTGTFDTGLTRAQLSEMVLNGWDVQGHNTAGQDYTLTTLAAMDTDVKAVKAFLATNNWPLSRVWCYQGGNHTDATDGILVANGVSWSDGGNPSNDARGTFVYGGLVQPMQLYRYTAEAVSAATTKVVIDHAVKYGEQVALLYHESPTAGCDTTCFQSTIDYLVRLRDANVIDLTTWSATVRRLTAPRWVRSDSGAKY